MITNSFDRMMYAFIDMIKSKSEVDTEFYNDMRDTFFQELGCTKNGTPVTKKKVKKFQKPLLQEIKDYTQEIKKGIEAQAFLDFYDSKGWKVGKTPMKDWKASVRNWCRNNESTAVESTPFVPITRSRDDIIQDSVDEVWKLHKSGGDCQKSLKKILDTHGQEIYNEVIQILKSWRKRDERK